MYEANRVKQKATRGLKGKRRDGAWVGGGVKRRCWHEEQGKMIRAPGVKRIEA